MLGRYSVSSICLVSKEKNINVTIQKELWKFYHMYYVYIFCGCVRHVLIVDSFVFFRAYLVYGTCLGLINSPLIAISSLCCYYSIKVRWTIIAQIKFWWYYIVILNTFNTNNNLVTVIFVFDKLNYYSNNFFNTFFFL
jgi:hypothetical protein